MRFQAPPREAVPATRFDHPAFRDFERYRFLLEGSTWPSIAQLEALWRSRYHLVTGTGLCFVEQTRLLVTDGLHYEQRIYNCGTIATRLGNWHDLFNALMWVERFELKCAVNAAYVREFANAPVSTRTRAQCALTHFDEGGALVLLHDEDLLARWDGHDWPGLFNAQAFAGAMTVLLFGHALLEQCLLPGALPVAKCLVVGAPRSASPVGLCEAVAKAITDGELLQDPKELRPLPLMGLPGWHPEREAPAFWRETPCFRPLRPGRRYPPAWKGAAGHPSSGLQGVGGLAVSRGGPLDHRHQ